MLFRGLPAFGVLEPAGAVVPDEEGLEVDEGDPDCVWELELAAVEDADDEEEAEPDGDESALEPGRTW